MQQIFSRLSQQFLQRLKLIVPPNKYQSVLNSYLEKRPITIRVNTLKTNSRELRDELLQKGIKMQVVSWNPNTFILPEASLHDLTKLDLYNSGYFYVQSLSSQIPPLILLPKPGETILDIAAAPGSKTTQMGALMQNKGKIFANDTNPIRLDKLKYNLGIQGVTNTETITKYPNQIERDYPDIFDKVLADVPCSGEGKIFLKDPKSLGGWSEKKIRGFAKIQKDILKAAITATKPGGKIVYSTCTLSPEENEEVINETLTKFSGKLTVEKIYIPGLSVTNALTKWNNVNFYPSIQNAIRILPSDLMEGFFVASLRKLRS